jgi:hypothetical protein
MSTLTHDTTTTTTPSRSGTRRVITPSKGRTLRIVAGVRFAVGIFLAVLGALLVSHGAGGLAALPLAFSVVHFAWGSWQLTIARSAAPQTGARGR